ncbi:oxygen-independent coproporphyrinogen III oxidase [Marinicella litoralis]|uniref:Coproporphyrinogen-III oxidase n=1 Tax=Marinicella litoralis TaxID=644220 RepID=A0A4R6XFZ9_9GAMM|nr:oxygen-independent coproporphyrinogen III oxidase [Marinicella litoralis]TDR18316.1 anaerobic coproporphyrinogen III oxidase [Marinicella litoralis]
MTQSNVSFDVELIKKYNLSGPRYTSYPTAVVFNEYFRESQHRKNLLSYFNESKNKPLSLYFHIPFCDTLCFFCACNKVATKKREKADIYLNYLEKEIQMQAALIPAERVVEQMHFGGGTPTFLTHPQLKRMMAMIDAHFNLLKTDDRDYSIEIDPREAAPDTIQLLVDLGFNRFSMGVQDVQEKVQKAVNRIQPIELTAQAISMCRNNGAKSINVDLIYGLPHQTQASFKDTLAQVIQLSPDRLSVFNYAHLPHLFMPQKRISEADLPSPDEKLGILQMTIQDLSDAGYVYIGMDHFAKPTDELAVAQKNGGLQRNFQGYTTHAACDLLAMGVSSISLINGTFSQNNKNLEAYYQQIELGQIPVMKGYQLNQDDKIRKQVIQDLCCHFSLNTDKISHQFDVDFSDYFAEEIKRLLPFESDGLISINDGDITVSKKGRLLIRNICMVFDQYLNQQSQQQFSKVI